jgi:hypothetical protein
LIRENKVPIAEALRSGEEHSQLQDELRRVQTEYRWAREIFRDAAKELDKEIGEETKVDETKSLVKELALRLAWYIDEHGDIPESEMVRLSLIANGFDRSERAEALRNLVVVILKYFDPDM